MIFKLKINPHTHKSRPLSAILFARKNNIYLLSKARKILGVGVKKGFSLIEVMVAIAILSAAFVTLSVAFPFGLAVTKTSEASMTAFYLAQEEIEQLNSLGYANINIGAVETKHRLSNDPANYLYSYQRETIVNYIDGNLAESASDQGLKKIFITVYYLSYSKTEKTYNIVTILSQK